MGQADWNRTPSIGAVSGAPVTVGNPGSGAKFTGTTQAALNSATASIASKGGIIQVLPGSVFNQTAELLFTDATDVWWILYGATFNIPAGVTFGSPIIAGGGSTWTQGAVLGNLTHCKISGLKQVNLNSTNGAISAICVGGNVTDTDIEDHYAANFTRWARSHTGYSKPTANGVTYDGPINYLTWRNAFSTGCGSNTVPDGGGTKFFMGTTTGTWGKIAEYNPIDLLSQFTTWDLNPQSRANAASIGPIERTGGYGTFNNNAQTFSPTGTPSVPPRPGNWYWSVSATANANVTLTSAGDPNAPYTLVTGATNTQKYTGELNITTAMIAGGYTYALSNATVNAGSTTFLNQITNACYGVFVEAAYASTTDSAKFTGGKYDMTGSGYGNGNIGFITGASARNVGAYNMTFANADIGWEIIGLAVAPEAGGGSHTYHALRSLRCVTGTSINPFSGGDGTEIYTVAVSNCIADDQGAGVMTTGLRMASTAARVINHLTISDSDFSKVASGGAALSVTNGTFAGFPNLTLRNLPGITDQGAIATPIGTATLNEIRAQGGNQAATTPSTGAAFTSYIPYGRLVASLSGGSTALTVTEMDGTTAGQVANGGAGSPTANIWYQVTNSAGTTLSWTGATFTGVAGVVAIGPDGTVYRSKDTTAANSVTLPQYSRVNFGALTAIVMTSAQTFTTLSATTLTSYHVPYGASINLSNVVGMSATVAVDGVTIAKPWLRYREMGIGGTTATVTSAIIYENRGMVGKLAAFAGGGLTISGPDATPIGPATLTDIPYAMDISPGMQFTCSTAPTFTLSRGSQ